MEHEEESTHNLDLNVFPTFSWTKGLLFYRIECNYINGYCETVARIPRWINKAEQLAAMYCHILDEDRDKLQNSNKINGNRN